MTLKILKPAEGRKVRDPRDRFQYLPTGGKRVRVTHYWLRRLKAGDVIEVAKMETPKSEPQDEAVEGKDLEDATY